MTGFTEADLADQSGKCFIITGANTGIGGARAGGQGRAGATRLSRLCQGQCGDPEDWQRRCSALAA